MVRISHLLSFISSYFPFSGAKLDQFQNKPEHNNTLVISNFNEQSHISLINHWNYHKDSKFNNWIENEIEFSHGNILLNIRNNDPSIIQDNFEPFENEIRPGVIIASSSRYKPNYFYQWTRDSAITALYLVSEGLQRNYTLYDNLVQDYINNSYLLQRVNNPSGNFTPVDNWSGLGEPKYYCNNTQFNLNWGRPQTDGPGLRLISILTYLINTDQPHQDLILMNICQFDVKYIISHWNIASFDPWEEVYSFHFFNNMVQLYGLKLYQYYFPTNPDYKQVVNTIQDIENFITTYYVSKDLSLIIETPNLWDERPSQVDIAVLIASLITHPVNPPIDVSMQFDTDNLLVLNVLYRLMQDMKPLYPINKNLHMGENAAVALGRYPEDIYDGIDVSEGNPWFLATCQGANILYRLVKSLEDKGMDLSVPLEQENFWYLFFKPYPTSTYNELILPYQSLAFNETIKQILNIADGFIEIVRAHVNEQGEMSEQFNKYSGYLTGATNLTWSYVEFINAITARDNILDYYK
ncbi:hypothetical protein MOUN0_I04214 [Monosporozyma unispora]|nr:hypothetical protein C6P44_004047 [Kazachstania unispora]